MGDMGGQEGVGVWLLMVALAAVVDRRPQIR